MTEGVLYVQEGHVVTLTLNQPETRNALTESMVKAVVGCCQRIAADHAIRAVILTGAGPAFCAGGSIKEMRDRSGLFGGSPAEMRDRYRLGIQQIPLALYELEVPTIAAVNGPAIGAGLDLSLMCDIRIASAEATFAESFVKMGIIPGDGGAWLLPRAVGMSQACEMVFTGSTMTANEALACRLVSRVTSAESLMHEANGLADRIAANPPEVLRMAKRLVREGQKQDLRSSLEMAAAFQAIAQHLPDHREAVDAFFAKRTPKFTGLR
ncbi:MAG: crotonase/enoyl-CoA hydratase family protein [Rhizobiales bacterium]|nr:crotonase/enoyl-CoA hydratase family protein [Hyphomicrobiales bacterium]